MTIHQEREEAEHIQRLIEQACLEFERSTGMTIELYKHAPDTGRQGQIRWHHWMAIWQ
jgi:23S rRNA-/tRNA-specific pseudouridylate synthase